MMNPLREPSAFTPNYWSERAAVLRSAVNNANPDIDPVLLEIALEGAEDVLQIEVELADQPLVGWTYNDNEISDLVAGPFVSWIPSGGLLALIVGVGPLQSHPSPTSTVYLVTPSGRSA